MEINGAELLNRRFLQTVEKLSDDTSSEAGKNQHGRMSSVSSLLRHFGYSPFSPYFTVLSKLMFVKISEST